MPVSGLLFRVAREAGLIHVFCIGNERGSPIGPAMPSTGMCDSRYFGGGNTVSVVGLRRMFAHSLGRRLSTKAQLSGGQVPTKGTIDRIWTFRHLSVRPPVHTWELVHVQSDSTVVGLMFDASG